MEPVSPATGRSIATRNEVCLPKLRGSRMSIRLAAAPSSWPEGSSPSDETSLQDLLFGDLVDGDEDDDDGDIDYSIEPSNLPLEVRPLAKSHPREVTELATLQSLVFSPHLKSMGSSYMQQRMFEQGLKDADCTLVALLSAETAASLLHSETDANVDEQNGRSDNLSGAAAVAEERAKARAAAAASDTAAAHANAPVVVGGAQAARVSFGGLVMGAEPILDIWYVSGVVVDPRARGLGIGRALVNGLIAAARSADPQVGAICLHVAPTNVAAINLYRGAGFIDYEHDAFQTTLSVEDVELKSAIRRADGAHEGETLMALKVVSEE